MEKENNNKKLIILSCLFAIISLSLIGYIFYDKYISKSYNSCDNNSTCDCNNKTAVDKQDDQSKNVKDDWINLEDLKKYQNFDNTYDHIDETDDPTIIANVFLQLDGKVYIVRNDNGETHYIDNLDGVIDMAYIIPYSTKCFFLLSNGDVYSYDLVDSEKNVFTASKENIGNVKRIFKYAYVPEDVVGGKTLVVMAVKDDGSIVVLESGLA